MLREIFAIMDGTPMPCASNKNRDLQNAHWKAFTQSVEVRNLFVWSFNEEIIYTAVNYAGSWHDLKLTSASGLYYPRLSPETASEYVVLGDSAFARSCAQLRAKSVGARKSIELGGASSDQLKSMRSTCYSNALSRSSDKMLNVVYALSKDHLNNWLFLYRLIFILDIGF